jgi:hypothetical protein
VQIPTDALTGNLVERGIEAQSLQDFTIRTAMEATNGSLVDFMLMRVFIVDLADWTQMHEI